MSEPTIESVTAELASANTLLTKAQSDLESTRNEAAKHRVGRNTALRQAHAMSVVLGKHNITFDASTADLGALSIEDGKVMGEFAYAPPAASAPPTPPLDKGKAVLTLKDVEAMSPDEINTRWEEISPLLGVKE